MCRSRRKLSDEYLLAKIGVDTAENEPLKVHLIFKLRDLISTEPPRPQGPDDRDGRGRLRGVLGAGGPADGGDDLPRPGVPRHGQKPSAHSHASSGRYLCLFELAVRTYFF